MDCNYVKDRITQLRIQKGVSEYKMSLDLGHSKGYVQSISSGRIMPSMGEFLSICDYLEIEPAAFFDVNLYAPWAISELAEVSRSLSEADQALLITLAKRLGSGRAEK